MVKNIKHRRLFRTGLCRQVTTFGSWAREWSRAGSSREVTFFRLLSLHFQHKSSIQILCSPLLDIFLSFEKLSEKNSYY